MPQKKPAVGFIFITLLIDVMGWGLIIPVMPRLAVFHPGTPHGDSMKGRSKRLDLYLTAYARRTI